MPLPVPVKAPRHARYAPRRVATALPRSAGLLTTVTPAASSAAIFSAAVPLPPEMIAPAWPIRRPGGAVCPAMNPTTGFFFYVPKSKIIEVPMSAEDAATLIMSCGVVQPGSDPQKRIAALAETANAARLANDARLQPEPAKVE